MRRRLSLCGVWLLPVCDLTEQMLVLPFNLLRLKVQRTAQLLITHVATRQCSPGVSRCEQLRVLLVYLLRSQRVNEPRLGHTL